MKLALLALCLLAAPAFAETHSPALSQYMGQLDCTTRKAVDQVSAGQPQPAAIALAVQECVPQPFTPEMRGLANSLRPSTRAERIAALTSSARLRFAVCEDNGMAGDRCIGMFSAAVDAPLNDASR